MINPIIKQLALTSRSLITLTSPDHQNTESRLQLASLIAPELIDGLAYLTRIWEAGDEQKEIDWEDLSDCVDRATTLLSYVPTDYRGAKHHPTANLQRSFEIVIELARENLAPHEPEYADERDSQLYACNQLEDFAVNHLGDD